MDQTEALLYNETAAIPLQVRDSACRQTQKKTRCKAGFKLLDNYGIHELTAS